MCLQYNEIAKIQGEFLAETNSEGFVRKIEVEGRDKTSSVIQQGQCVGLLFPLMNNETNKI